MEYYIWFIFDFIRVPKRLFYKLVSMFCDDSKYDSFGDLKCVTYYKGIYQFGFEIGFPHE